MFSHVAKMTLVWILISLVATYHSPLHQLDIKNVFMHGILDEGVCIKQPSGFVAQGVNGKIY